MNLSNLLGKININLELLSDENITSAQNRHELCIGGPLANESSNIYMKMFIPDFKCILNKDDAFFTCNDANFYMDLAEKNSNDEKQYFVIGDNTLEFSPDNSSEWGFILKLEKGYNKFCFILFSETGLGTLAVVNFFCENYVKLYDMFKENPFFIAVKLRVKGRMLADLRTMIDLSEYIHS